MKACLKEDLGGPTFFLEDGSSVNVSGQWGCYKGRLGRFWLIYDKHGYYGGHHGVGFLHSSQCIFINSSLGIEIVEEGYDSFSKKHNYNIELSEDLK